MNYLLHILIMICLYVMLGLSLNLLVGYGGLLSIAHAAFYGIGAYIHALLLTHHFPWFISLVVSVSGTALFAYIIAYPMLKLRGEYFILATIGLQIIIFNIIYNWGTLTRGSYGVPGIPRASIFGFEFESTLSNLLLIGFFAIGVIMLCKGVYNSPFGRVLKSIRENELISRVFGKNTVKVKIHAFALASAIAALAGALYASYASYVHPSSYTIEESIFILAIVLVGGSGNLKGTIVGAVFLVILPEMLRFLGLPARIAPNIRQIIYALAILFLMFKRPQGIFGEYKLE